MTEKEKYIEHLRELADFYERASDDLPRPLFNEVVYIEKEDIPNIIKSCHKLTKSSSNGYVSLVKDLDFGKINFRIAQAEVCERKVIGQTWIPEYKQEAHFSDQVEWECKPILSKIADGDTGER